MNTKRYDYNKITSCLFESEVRFCDRKLDIRVSDGRPRPYALDMQPLEDCAIS